MGKLKLLYDHLICSSIEDKDDIDTVSSLVVSSSSNFSNASSYDHYKVISCNFSPSSYPPLHFGSSPLTL